MPGKLISRTIAVAAAALLLALGARADGDGGGGGSGSVGAEDVHMQPNFQQAIAAINGQRWDEAIRLMRSHVLRNDSDADGHNWLAYAYRKSGRLDDALRHYRRALGIDPRHLGAHEYIGEAYLMAKQPDEARKHLQRLAEICGTQCEQYRDLQRAIAESTASRLAAASAQR